MSEQGNDRRRRRSADEIIEVLNSTHAEIKSSIEDHQRKVDTRFQHFEQKLDDHAKEWQASMRQLGERVAGVETSVTALNDTNREQWGDIKSARDVALENQTKLNEFRASAAAAKANGDGFWYSANGRIALIVIALMVVGFFAVLGVKLGINPNGMPEVIP
jgi:uncharacterized coiled-coil protein SlyX